MSVLVVGLSHKSAPVAVLERAVPVGDTAVKLLHDVRRAEDVAGSLVVSTCNRVEVYAEVGSFHGGLSAICELLARHSGIGRDELTPYLQVRYEDRAVQHLLSVACGLDSLVVGESQILGQVKRSIALAREQGTLGRTLADLGAVAIRAGKRAHAETGIDRAGASLVSVGLAAVAELLRGAADGAASGAAEAAADLAGRSVLVVGAGSMSSLAATTAARMGAARVVIANRTPARARRLAKAVSGSAVNLTGLPGEITAADLVVSCTGAPGPVITGAVLAAALAARPTARGPVALLDLALPRDVEPAAASMPGVTLLDLETLKNGAGGGNIAAREEDIAAVRGILAEELAGLAAAADAARVAPTVVALRARAAEVVDGELARLSGRIGLQDASDLAEIARSMHRVADKLLHAPTVRVKELAGSPGGASYEAALRVLFDLDPEAVQAVIRADAELSPAHAEQETR